MPERRFLQLDRQQFAALLDRFRFDRKINAVHMHHTWKPNHAQYRGEATILGMWRFHTQTNKWSDIAQHISIAPDGTIWLGRNWNAPPASAAGHNGNTTAGPFMFEMIGNFDAGNDRLEGEQLKTVIEVIGRVQHKFNLPAETLAFHNAMSGKTCPGDAVQHADILKQVKEFRNTLPAAAMASRSLDDQPFALSARADGLELSRDLHPIVREAILTWSREAPIGKDSPDAELRHDHTEAEMEFEDSRDLGGTPALSPDALEALRPHLVNLNMGQLSSDGEFKTSKGDVDAIFEQHLPKALENAAKRNTPLQVVFFAHGGLVKESNGLKIAHKHIGWWLQNNIYPIYFVWETGLFETIGQILRRGREGATRALTRDIFDHTSDPLLEATARALQGPRIWAGMKLSAERAAAEEGGARYVATKLKEFCDAHAQVELHAAGHSAGSIFHAHFIPEALRQNVPHFKTLHFLAPAIRVDTFKKMLGSHIGKGAGKLTIYTMNKTFEQNDHCANVYRKSLLYLIHHALEAELKTPILGLEASLREDDVLKKMLGLGATSAVGEVIFSKTTATSGSKASSSTTHGGFDDDSATMGSVARRILNRSDNDAIAEYPPPTRGTRALNSWDDQVDWPEEMRLSLSMAPVQPIKVSAHTAPDKGIPASAGQLNVSGGSGRNRALCVGINTYPTAPLHGCVSDAQNWASALSGLGFAKPTLLLDQQATRARIEEELRSLVSSSKSGDVIVFQYAGHGTQLPDVDGEEASGDSPGKDEAICPIDFADGHFFIDDDIGEIFNRLPAGVNLTCFIDCCHSGTISRFAVGSGLGTAGPDQRPRFLVATPAMKEAHKRFRSSMGGRRSLAPRGLSLMPEVVFSACLSTEVAWESGGAGDFTTRALRVLAGGVGGLTNESFEERVISAFGATARQHPRLYCQPNFKTARLLQPLA